MSRIQEILNKAERDGTMRRTRPLADEYAARPATADEAIQARGFVEPPRAAPPAPESAPVRPPRPERVAAAAPAVAVEPRAARVDAAPLREPAPPSASLPSLDAMPHVNAEFDPHLVAALAPTSLAAEQYRSLRTRLRQAENGRPLRMIAVTSPNKGDGKSLTAANLALTMAQEFQQRVLLVDCDLRRPSVHHLFGLGDGPGLGDVLMNVAELDQVLVALPEHHLTVLPAGIPPTNPAELLGSATMRRVLDTLRTRFDRILIDVPPVAPLADLHVLAPMVDGLLMIVRAGVTPKPAIERALSGLDTSKVLGLVLNDAGTSAAGYGYGGYGYVAG